MLVFTNLSDKGLSWLLLKTKSESDDRIPSRAKKLKGPDGIISIGNCKIFYNLVDLI